MIELGEAYFIQHCDEVGCDLGTFEYRCPKCGICHVDYEIWWEEDNIWKGKKVSFPCPSCGNVLVVEYDKNNHGFIVKQLKYEHLD